MNLLRNDKKKNIFPTYCQVTFGQKSRLAHPQNFVFLFFCPIKFSNGLGVAAL